MSTREKVMDMRRQAVESKTEPPQSSSGPSTSTSSTSGADEQKASALQQSIENSLADNRVRLPLGGERIRFKTFNGRCEGHPDTGGEISDRVALNDERLDRMNADDFENQYQDESEWMCMTLAWAADPEFMTTDWIKANLGIVRRKEYLNMIQIEREFSEEQLKNLRRRGRL